MSGKDKINELRDKLLAKKQELQVEEKVKEVESRLEYVAHDVFQDPDKKGRHFKMVQIKYDPLTKEAVVTDVRHFEDKTAGLSFVMDKDNRKYLFNKCKRSES